MTATIDKRQLSTDANGKVTIKPKQRRLDASAKIGMKAKAERKIKAWQKLGGAKVKVTKV